MSDNTHSPETTPKLIAITGYARSGKDTIAEHLIAQHGFQRVSFADEVREAALALDPIVQINLRIGVPVRLSSVVSRDGWDAAKAIPEVRRTLQRLSTEAGKNFHGDDIWVRLAAPKVYDLWESGTSAVITDLRFPNEVDWVHSIGGQVWKVQRPVTDASLTGENAVHATESHIDSIRADTVIDNDAGLDTLFERVSVALGVEGAARSAFG